MDLADPLLARLSDSLAEARSLEALARPLLELLEGVAGFESTYLTAVDLEQGVQRILYARNSRDLVLPEGLVVPWEDTLCKRALDAGTPFTDDVAGRWGDSEAARDLGIRSYASAPVRLGDGLLHGTLCVASAQQRPLSPQAQQMLRLFSSLLAQQFERERLVQQLQRANLELTALASSDALTRLPNRRVLHGELSRLLARGRREGRSVLVAWIDLDGFKAINDQHGHDTGDAFLLEVAARLQSALRSTDLLARLGGDEFAVVGPGPEAGPAAEGAAAALRERLAHSTVGDYALKSVTLAYQGASVGAVAVPPGEVDTELALRRADQAMYQVKRSRQAAR